jgi:hypothetical protein
MTAGLSTAHAVSGDERWKSGVASTKDQYAPFFPVVAFQAASAGISRSWHAESPHPAAA